MSAVGPKLRAVVSHNHCAGAGMCVYHSPEAFKFNEQRLAVFDPDGGWTAAAMREAAESCPMGAITILEDDPV
jgi:ferredoxin